MSASLAGARISQTFHELEHNEASSPGSCRLDVESPRMSLTGPNTTPPESNFTSGPSNAATHTVSLRPPEFREKEKEEEPTTTSASTSNHDSDAGAQAIEKGLPLAYSVFTKNEKWFIVVIIAFAGLLRYIRLLSSFRLSCHST